jgi:TP901 family phage tail tape measure protein/lambda family phage tail tape measure protein
MATANLSVGINTTKAKSDLQELKTWMAKGLTDMTLSINSTALQTSINTAMKGPSGGYRLHINAAQLKTDVADALKGAVAGAKVGGGSIDSTQIAAGIKQIKQTLSTGLAEAGQEGGKRLTKTITDDFGNLVTISHKAGVAAGKAAATGMEEGAKTAKISYRFKEGAGAVGASLPTSYTAEQVKAKAIEAEADKAAKASMLRRISQMREEFEARKQLNSLNEAGYRQQELAKLKSDARLQALNETGHRQMQYRQIQQSQALTALNEAGYRQQELAKLKSDARLQALNETGHRQMQYRQIQQSQALTALNEAGYRQQELAKLKSDARLQALNETGHRQMQYRQIQQSQALTALNEAGYRQQELAKLKSDARLQALNETGHRQMQYRQIQQSQALTALNEAGYRQQELAKQSHQRRMEILDAKFSASSAASQLNRAKLAEALIARGVNAANTVGPLAASFGNAQGIAQLASQIRQVGQAHSGATTQTKAHTAAMHDAHSAARGLASGMGMMWLTWGNIAPLLAGASLSHGFIQAMKAGTEFAYQLTFVKALGGETADSVRGIGAAALEMSKSGLYGPVELANGLRTLSQAGVATKDSMMALPQVFDLATVGEMNMKDAALTLAGVMTAFKLEVKDMSHIGDVFAKAAAVSQTSVEQLTQAMKMASVVGYQYGASVEDTATALTLLAKMNITGTAAGTSLRNMLKELYTPTEKAASIMKNLGLSAQTAAGELKPFPDVVYALKGKLEEFNKASQTKILQGIFGERGAKEAIAMLSLTREEWDKLNKTISESGGFMAKVSAELEATTKGSFKKAINTLQSTLIEAFLNTEGAAGQLAIKLQQTFSSETFKTAVNGIVTGMLGLTNALVAMGPVLAMVAAGWVAVKAAIVVEATWTLVAAGITNVSMTLKAFTLVATGAATAVGGSTGLMAALRMVLGPFGLLLTAVTAVTAALGYLYNRMGDYGYANALANSTNTAASAMENLANKTRAATAELRRQRREKEGKTEIGQSLSVVQKAENDRKDTKALLDSLTDAQRTGGISMERGFMISSLTSSLREQDQALVKLRKNYGEATTEFNEGLRERSKIATLDSEEVIRGMPTSKLKPSQVAAKKTAEGTAEWLKQNTEFIIQNYGEQAATILDRVTKNLNEQVQDAKIATGTRNADEVTTKGGGGRADREAAKLENANVLDLEKRYQAELKTIDAYYAKLEKIESTSAQYGIKTKEEAESKITALTEEHWTKRLEKVSTMSDEMSALLGKSVKLSEADAQKAKTFVATAQEEINTLKEKIEWIKEEARLKAEGAAIKFNKDIDKNNVDLTKELELAKAAVYGKVSNPVERARNNAETLVSNRYAQMIQEAVDARIQAEQSGNEAAIKATAERLELLDQEVQKSKQYYGDQYAALAEYQQTASYGWDKFWEKYEENATTAAKVVEQSLESVTKNIEDAFADMFKTGKFDAKKMVDSILSDVGRLVAKLAVSDIGNLLFGKGKPSGDVLGSIFGMSGKKEGEGNQPEGLSGLLTKAAEGLKSFWNSLTGATSATVESTAKTVEDVLTMGTKKVAETSSTAALTELAAAAQMAATSLSMVGSTGGGGGGGILSGLLGAIGGSGTSAASATADFVPYAWANGGAFRNGIQAFAKGGTFSNSIVRQPTLFRFADGTGMMGEAGPEAIMPLTRDSQGRLGVRYEGREPPNRKVENKVTNNNVSVSINAPGGDPAKVRRSGAAVAREVANAVAGSGRYR